MKVKTLKLDLMPCSSVSASYLDPWLKIAVKSGVKKLNLSLSPSMKEEYRFPCSVLFDEATASSSESLDISRCTFHPIGTLGCFRRLKSLILSGVRITEEGLQQLLSKSFSLERLEVFPCNEIICLKIPCTLQNLKFLLVGSYQNIQVIEISAPNLSAFHHYYGLLPKIYIGDSSQLTNYICHLYIRPEFALIVVRSFHLLSAMSRGLPWCPTASNTLHNYFWDFVLQNVNAPMLPEKLLHLKSFEIGLNGSGACSPVYDIFSLVSFLDASPALESFTLRIWHVVIIQHCDAGDDDEHLRWKSAYQHDRLKRVMITGFCSATSLIKLVTHILESSPLLEPLTLDTTPDCCGSLEILPYVLPQNIWVTVVG